LENVKCENASNSDNVVSITDIGKFRGFVSHKQWQKINEIADYFIRIGCFPGDFFQDFEDNKILSFEVANQPDNYTCDSCGGYNPEKIEHSLCHRCRTSCSNQ